MSDITRLKVDLNLGDVEGLHIDEYNRTFNLMDDYINYKLKCTFYDCLPFELDLSVSKQEKTTRALKIQILEEHLHKELLICTNYLKRQCNHNFALAVLKKLAKLVGYRKLILQLLCLELPDEITISYDTFGGCIINCEDKINGFKFFESSWIIKFSCVDVEVMDFVDFFVNVRNRTFYEQVTPVMKGLTDPHMHYPRKVQEWSFLIESVKSKMHILAQLRPVQEMGEQNYSRIFNVETEAIQIPDDDEDDDVQANPEMYILINDD